MKLFSQSGFSVLPVMIAISAAAGMGYYLMTEQNSMSRLKSKEKVNQSVDSASQIIKTALSNSQICTLNLQNKGIGDELLTPLVDTSGVDLAHKNQDYPELEGIKLLKMRIMSYKNPVTLEVADYLYVTYDTDPLKKKKLLGSSTIGKKFRLRGNKVAGKYTFCYHEESNLVEMAVKKNCIDSQGVWDGSAWKCTVDPSSLVDSTSVVCPVGKVALGVVSKKLKAKCAP
jgi:hypothetical protein